MEKKLEIIITEAIKRDVKSFYNDIEAMEMLRKRFENLIIFICNSESKESEEETDQLVDETERMIFELDKKIRAYHNESNSDKFILN